MNKNKYFLPIESVKYTPIGSERFRRMQDQKYYNLEKTFIKPSFWHSDGFNFMAERFLAKGNKNILDNAKDILNDYIQHFGLEKTDVKTTVRKDLSSYYNSNKDCVFINKNDLNYFKKKQSINSAKELLFILIHELNHAYVGNRIYYESYHDNFYLDFTLDAYEYLFNIDKKAVLKEMTNSINDSRFHLSSSKKYYQNVIFDNLDQAKNFCYSVCDKQTDTKVYENAYNFEGYNADFRFDYKVDDLFGLVSSSIYKINNKYHVIFTDMLHYFTLLEEKETELIAKH